MPLRTCLLLMLSISQMLRRLRSVCKRSVVPLKVDVVLQADVKDAVGLTPLHLAAIAPDESLAERLLEACKCSAAAWFNASAADGLTPAHFAARLSRHGLNARILLLAQADEVQPSCGRHTIPCSGQALENAVLWGSCKLVRRMSMLRGTCRDRSHAARRVAVGARVETVAHAASRVSADVLLHLSPTAAAASQWLRRLW